MALAAMAFASCSAPGLAAETVQPGQGSLNASLGGFDITLPVPDWFVDNGAPLDDQARVSVRRTANGVAEMLVNRPDEDAISWTQRLGVLAIARPGYTAGLQFRNVATSLAARCMRDQFDFSWIVPLENSDREALVGMCGRFALNAQAGNPCDGSIVAAVAIEKPEGVVSAYYQWCTGSFDVSDAAGWPVARDRIEAHARALQKLTDFEPARGDANGSPDTGAATGTEQ